MGKRVKSRISAGASLRHPNANGHILKKRTDKRDVANLTIYVVRPGDSVYAIARLFGVSMQTIIEDNALSNPDVLVVGQALVIRTGTTATYRVAPGDTLYAIARSRGVSLTALIAANPQITNPDLIYVGQVINIPVAPPLGRAIDVNGYVLPGISPNVLARTLFPTSHF